MPKEFYQPVVTELQADDLIQCVQPPKPDQPRREARIVNVPVSVFMEVVSVTPFPSLNLGVGSDIALATAGKVRFASGAGYSTVQAGETGGIDISHSSDVNLGFLDVRKEIRVNGVKVVGERATGWDGMGGTATRTSFQTSTVTTEQLAQRVKALIDDLQAHGLLD